MRGGRAMPVRGWRRLRSGGDEVRDGGRCDNKGRWIDVVGRLLARMSRGSLRAAVPVIGWVRFSAQVLPAANWTL